MTDWGRLGRRCQCISGVVSGRTIFSPARKGKVYRQDGEQPRQADYSRAAGHIHIIHRCPIIGFPAPVASTSRREMLAILRLAWYEVTYLHVQFPELAWDLQLAIQMKLCSGDMNSNDTVLSDQRHEDEAQDLQLKLKLGLYVAGTPLHTLT